MSVGARARVVATITAGLAVTGACRPPEPPEVGGLACGERVTLRFTPDPGTVGDELYLCFGFEPGGLDAGIRALAVHTVEASPVWLHHLSLYAVTSDFPDGPVACPGTPENASALNVWAPGGAPLVLPEGIALALPDGTARLVVQSHAVRVGSGVADEASIELCTAAEPPVQWAAWLRALAPVPAIRPHSIETSVATCRPPEALTVFSTWPHMHRAGAEFHGTIVRASGARDPLVEVVPWLFAEQHSYAVDASLEAGDAIETACTWRNDGDEYILPGLGADDEMCGQSLIVWPASAASCAP